MNQKPNISGWTSSLLRRFLGFLSLILSQRVFKTCGLDYEIYIIYIMWTIWSLFRMLSRSGSTLVTGSRWLPCRVTRCSPFLHTLEPMYGGNCQIVDDTCYTCTTTSFPLTPPMPPVTSHRRHESGNFELCPLLCTNYAFVHASPFSFPFTHTRRA